MDILEIGKWTSKKKEAEGIESLFKMVYLYLFSIVRTKTNGEFTIDRRRL